jgi:hypothetical protein
VLWYRVVFKVVSSGLKKKPEDGSFKFLWNHLQNDTVSYPEDYNLINFHSWENLSSPLMIIISKESSPSCGFRSSELLCWVAGYWFPVFQRNILPSPSRVKESCFQASTPLKIKVVHSFAMSGIKNPATQCNNSPDSSVYTVYRLYDGSKLLPKYSVFFSLIEKVLVNVGDIIHVQPFSEVCVLQLHSPCFMPFLL